MDLSFKQLVELQREEVSRAQAKLDNLISSCTHEELVEQEQYSKGSDHDPPCTRYWKQCVVCGEQFDKTFVQHGEYW